MAEGRHEGGSLVERASERIVRLIMDRGYGPGVRIPSEPELCALLGASRNTVREAIRALVSRNVLEIRRGNGTFVSPKGGIPDDPLGLTFLPDKRKVARDLMQIRFLLEPAIAALAAQNADRADAARLERAVEAFEAAVGRGEDPVAQDIAFHRQLAACSKNVVLPNLIPVISETIRVFTDIRDGKEIAVTLRNHREILEAVKRREPCAAQDAMTLHLAYNRDKLRRAIAEETVE